MCNRYTIKLRNLKKGFHLRSGFTIIEILVSIAIVGILAAITIVSYNGYQNSIITATLKSDLNGVAAAMENARNFSNAYPVDITTLSTIKPSSGVVLSGGSIDGKIYCITAASSQNTTLSYFISSSSNGTQQGSCITTTPTLTATVASSTSINLSWTLVVNATSYTLQRDTNSSFSGATTIATPSGSTSSFTSTGLTSGTTYYYRVRASNVSGNGVWSATANATTPFTYVLTTIAGTGGSVSSGGTYNSGSTPTITATPNTGYLFSSWSGSTGCSGVASHTITMDANKSCTANFTPTAIAAPAAPTVAANTAGATTTWSWGAASCPGNTARYQYNYTISPSGYNSGWVAIASTSVAFTTSSEGYTYTVAVQAQCYNAITSSSWGGSGSANYYRPVTTYVLTTVTGTGGTVSTGGTYSANSTPTITATPNTGYSFSSWSGSTGCSGIASHTVTMDANKTCTASFVLTAYYYNKYNSVLMYNYVQGAWVDDGIGSNSFNGWGKSYTFDASTGFYAYTNPWTGQEYVPIYSTMYLCFNGSNTIWKFTNQVSALYGYYEFTSPQSKKQKAISYLQGTYYIAGTLVQSNIIALDGTYPANGRYATDGYWYIKGALAN